MLHKGLPTVGGLLPHAARPTESLEASLLTSWAVGAQHGPLSSHAPKLCWALWSVRQGLLSCPGLAHTGLRCACLSLCLVD